MWYALHGYDIQAMPTARGMYGHGRVLPPHWRDPEHCLPCSRLLLTKAARRMRRDGYYAGRLWLWLDMRSGAWFGQRELPCVQDDHACLAALAALWEKARAEIPRRAEIVRVGVTLLDLSPANARQLDLLSNDDGERAKVRTHHKHHRPAKPEIREAGGDARRVDAAARRICRRQDCLQPDSFGGGLLVTWLEDSTCGIWTTV